MSYLKFCLASFSIFPIVAMQNQDPKVLLQKVKELNKDMLRNCSKVSLLMTAAHYGLVQTAQLLINNGSSDVNARDSDMWTALMFASDGGHTEIIDILLKNGADIEAKSKSMRTALMIAAYRGYTQVIMVLLNAGAQIDAQNDAGYTALMYAAFRDYSQVVQLLLDNNADVNAHQWKGMNAIMLASEEGHDQVVQVLLNNADNIEIKNSLFIASKKGHTEVVKVLLDYGVDCNTHFHDGLTALMVAAQNGHIETVQVLLNNGADCNAINFIRETALITATQNKQLEAVNFLLDNGANIDAIDKFGLSALWYSACFEDTKFVQLLLDRGVSLGAIHEPKMKYIAEKKLTHQILKSLCQIEVQKYLSDKSNYCDLALTNAQPFCRYKYKQTLLMWATIFNDLVTLKKIMATHPPCWYINAQDIHGQTALHYAAWFNRDLAVLEILLYVGKGIILKNKQNLTVLDLAIMQNNRKYASRMIQASKLFLPSLIKASNKLNTKNIEIIKEYLIAAISTKSLNANQSKSIIDTIRDFLIKY